MNRTHQRRLLKARMRRERPPFVGRCNLDPAAVSKPFHITFVPEGPSWAVLMESFGKSSRVR